MYLRIKNVPKLARRHSWWYENLGGLILDIRLSKKSRDAYRVRDTDFNRKQLFETYYNHHHLSKHDLERYVFDGDFFIDGSDAIVFEDNEGAAQFLHKEWRTYESSH